MKQQDDQNKVSVLFLGGKEIGFFCLQHIVEMQSKLNTKLVGCFLQETKNAIINEKFKSIGDTHDIPIFYDSDVIPEADIFISVQYHKILRQHDLKKAKKVAVNLHMAPLPEYRGCNQFSFAIINEEVEFGTTIHTMTERVDGGDVLFETRFPIPDQVMVKELYDLTVNHSKQLFESSWLAIVLQKISPIPQSEIIKTSHYYMRKDINRIKKIDLNWPKEKIDRHIRATSFPGFSGPNFEKDGNKYCTVIPKKM